MERWIALGIYPPLAKLDKCGTYLEQIPKDVTNLLVNYCLSSNVKVHRYLNIVTVEIGDVDVFLRLDRKNRELTIAQVVQNYFDEPASVHSYPLGDGFHLEFDETANLDWRNRKKRMSRRLAALPICIDLIEALIAAEAI